MRIFKNKAFNKWAKKEHICDQALFDAVMEIEALRALASELLGDSHSEIANLIKAELLVEVINDG